MILRLKILSRAKLIFFKVKISLLLSKFQQRKLHFKLTINYYVLLPTPIISITLINIVIIVAITTTVLVSYVWWYLKAAGAVQHWIQAAPFHCIKREERGRNDINSGMYE